MKRSEADGNSYLQLFIGLGIDGVGFLGKDLHVRNSELHYTYPGMAEEADHCSPTFSHFSQLPYQCMSTNSGKMPMLIISVGWRYHASFHAAEVSHEFYILNPSIN